jgi:hypothetical protein
LVLDGEEAGEQAKPLELATQRDTAWLHAREHGCCPTTAGDLKPGISPPTLCDNSEETRWQKKLQRLPPMSRI